MRVLVTPMRSRGIALDPKARCQYTAIRGNVMVNSSVCNELGRAANVARVDVGMPLDPDPLPPLLACRYWDCPICHQIHRRLCVCAVLVLS